MRTITQSKKPLLGKLTFASNYRWLVQPFSYGRLHRHILVFSMNTLRVNYTIAYARIILPQILLAGT